MWQIIFPPDTLGLHTGDILQPAHPDQDHIVLLQVVTLARDIGCQLPASGQLHKNTLQNEVSGNLVYAKLLQVYLSVSTVGFLRFLNNRFDDNSFGKGNTRTKWISVGPGFHMNSLPMFLHDLRPIIHPSILTPTIHVRWQLPGFLLLQRLCERQGRWSAY